MIRLVALLIVLTVAAAPSLATADPAPTAPIRAVRRLSLSATGEGLFADEGHPSPFGGLLLSYNVLPRLALDLSYRTMLFVNTIDAGVRYFFLEHEVSPYLYARGGLTVAGMAHEIDTTVAANLTGGAGVELATRFGLCLFLEGGVDAYFGFGPAYGGRVAGGVGYRF